MHPACRRGQSQQLTSLGHPCFFFFFQPNGGNRRRCLTSLCTQPPALLRNKRRRYRPHDPTSRVTNRYASPEPPLSLSLATCTAGASRCSSNILADRSLPVRRPTQRSQSPRHAPSYRGTVLTKSAHPALFSLSTLPCRLSGGYTTCQKKGERDVSAGRGSADEEARGDTPTIGLGRAARRNFRSNQLSKARLLHFTSMLVICVLMLSLITR